MGRLLRQLPGAQPWVGAGDVEIAQDAELQGMRRGKVDQHALDHRLGRGIGVDRRQRQVLGQALGLWRAINRGGGGEQEAFDAFGKCGFRHRQRVGDIVAIIFGRVLNQFNHRDRAGAMDDAGDAGAPDGRPHQADVAAIAAHQVHAFGQQRPAAVRHVIKDNHRRAAIVQRMDDVGADIAGAAGHEDHGVCLCQTSRSTTPAAAAGAGRPARRRGTGERRCCDRGAPRCGQAASAQAVSTCNA